jgi:transcription initiation factor TFIID subunit 10
MNGTGNAEAGPSSPRATPAQVNGNAEPETSALDAQAMAQAKLANLFAARRAEEQARKDRSLGEFLVMLDGYKPLVSRPRPCRQTISPSRVLTFV